jgi:hypothetical protein
MENLSLAINSTMEVRGLNPDVKPKGMPGF